MAATPKEISAQPVKWFPAKYAGQCSRCNTNIHKTDFIGFDGDDKLVGFNCCYTSMYNEGSIGFDDEERINPVSVMPRGKTPLDRCDKCFIIHATRQVECE